MYFSTYDAIYFATVVVFASWGCIANGLLLFMIIWRSPEHLSPYRVFLGNTAFTQLLLAVVSVFIAPRILAEGSNIVSIYLGPSQLLGPWYSVMLYVTMLHLTLNSFVSLMISMIYRCICLRHSNIKTTTAVLMCIVGYVTPFSLIPPYLRLTYSANVTEADQITHHMVLNMNKYSVVASANVLQIPILWTMFCCLVLLVPIYGTIYFCRWKILTLLEKATFAHSQQMKVNIKRFVKALTLQSLVPTLSIFPPAAAYSLIQFGVLRPQLLSYFIVPSIGIGPAIDPMVTIYYVTPYRRFVTSTLLSWPFINLGTRHEQSSVNNEGDPKIHIPRKSLAPQLM
ncbi:7TM chemoreceptor [Ancylostoma caninum]|uniref:7TM chemoreceptor n=1 Tax=Ancylostoma caninum TaxID=29170 RepID=A0A368H8W9_ANCCA|nr:7TM chemoreceptor [Ancylostoma caninum]